MDTHNIIIAIRLSGYRLPVYVDSCANNVCSRVNERRTDPNAKLGLFLLFFIITIRINILHYLRHYFFSRRFYAAVAKETRLLCPPN